MVVGGVQVCVKLAELVLYSFLNRWQLYQLLQPSKLLQDTIHAFSTDWPHVGWLNFFCCPQLQALMRRAWTRGRAVKPVCAVLSLCTMSADWVSRLAGSCSNRIVHIQSTRWFVKPHKKTVVAYLADTCSLTCALA